MLIAVQERPEHNLEAFIGKLTFIIPKGMIPPENLIPVIWGIRKDSPNPQDRERFEKYSTVSSKEARYVIEHSDGKGVLVVPESVFKTTCKPIDSIPFEDVDAKAYYYCTFETLDGARYSCFSMKSPVDEAIQRGHALLNCMQVTKAVYDYHMKPKEAPPQKAVESAVEGSSNVK